MFKKLILNSLKKAIVKTKCYHLKLFYLSIYCLLIVGCGKKIEKTQQPQVQRSSLQAKFIELKAKLFKTGKAIDETYSFEKDSEITIPEIITVKQGNAGNNTARIYFNKSDNDEFGFYCSYIGGASTTSPIAPDDYELGKQYYFDTCYTQENDVGEINYYPGYEAIQYKNKSIKFRLISADPRFDTEAFAQFEVEFH